MIDPEITILLSFIEAYCKAFRTKLAEPMTADQMTFLKGEVKKYPSRKYIDGLK